jgi:transketolase
MLNPNAKLVANVFGSDMTSKSTRDGFGLGAVELGKENSDIIVLCADLSESTRAEWFQKEFPDRFVQVGVAEQNMAALASGFAQAGKIPFITSYAAFSPGRNYEQIRTTVALNEMPVKVCGMHAGVSVGPDGATHQMLEDIGLMRMLPNMIVLVPSDAEEARKAVIEAGKHNGPVYIRFGRSNVPVYTTPETPFSVGKALELWRSEKTKVALMATGSMAYNALLAARALESDGIGSIVLSVPTVKPLDQEKVLACARSVSHVVTIEEHQIAGGFGSAIAEYLSEAHPVRVTRLGLNDTFGQSGEPDELIHHYGLDGVSIAGKVRRLFGMA